MSASTPYGSLRVIEVANDPAGEMVGLQLRTMGADVIKVEPPEGAASRRAGPYAGGIEGPDRSLAYWYYNAGKRSIVLDVAGDGRAPFDGLLASADVLVSTLSPAELRNAGLDFDAVQRASPALVIASVTAFGLTGPWADYRSSDLVGLAASGLLNTSGYDDHSIPPIRPGGDQAFHTAASFAHIATLLALVERQRTGRGGLVDVSMHESAALTVELSNPFWFYPRVIAQRQTCRHAQPVPTQPALFECADGRYVYFAFIIAEQKTWNIVVDWLDSQSLAVDLTDEAFLEVKHRQQNFGHIQTVLECFFLLQDSHDAYHEGQRRGLPLGVLNAPEDVLEDEHLRERGFFVHVEQPGFGDVVRPGPVLRFSEYDSASPAPAPSLGEHTAEVLAAISR